MISMRHLSLLNLTFCAGLIGAPLPEVVDFNDHIQPLLSENCYHCHGPDSSTREPKSNPLRLDREEYAFLERPDGKPTIIKGDPDNSEFIKRIISTDEDNVMPPPKSHKKPLKPDQVALFKKWIAQGAPYEEHWAFIPPTKPEVPAESWGNNNIDKFIAKKHKELHLEPNKPAENARLFRRLTFDLTGLPPTPAEVAAFEKTSAEDPANAINASITKLLDSDAYAEHFGRHWLDAARYADTHGIHIDNRRSIWPYRDWVINAFRKNMRFDEFTIKQLAGDLMPNATLDQKIATGFNRCLPTTGEGGAIASEYEVIYATDRVSTTSAIWLGLTTACAACHDHKFDPISQKDFYQLSAFFRNSTMPTMDRNLADHPPAIFAPLYSDQAQWVSLEKGIKEVDKKAQQHLKVAENNFQKWLPTAKETPLKDPQLTAANVSLPFVVNQKKFQGTIEGQVRDWSFTGRTRNHGKNGKIARISNLNLNLGDILAFKAEDQVTFSSTIYLEKPTTGALISRMHTKKQSRGWDLWVENGKIGAHFVESSPKKMIKVLSNEPISLKKWTNVVVTYDGTVAPKERVKIYLNGEPTPITYVNSSDLKTITTSAPARLGGRHPNVKYKGAASLYDFQFYRGLLTQEEIQAGGRYLDVNNLVSTPYDQLNELQKNSLFAYYSYKVDPIAKKLRQHKAQLVNKQSPLRRRGSMTLITEEKKGEAYAHILDRGDYSLPKEKVFAGIPEIFQNGTPKPKQSRKDLAEWLVSSKNPLTARVTVNRLWYYFFGLGIVETTEDFGIMGARPTHPELLDYLAVEFMESGWDLQHIIKLIAGSATYQLSDHVTSSHREKDPTNLYLARSSRHRLEAEQIRDMALSTSGLLVHKFGGPPVKPYQPEGIWKSVAMKQSNTRYYKPSTGEGLYRRSLYTFLKRTAAPPNMEILNAPTREVFCVRRDRTNTPLQAFVTLNDTQFIESSRELATEALKKAESFEDRLAIITLSLMSRTFDSSEQAIVRKALDHHLTRYRDQPELAKKLITVGASKPAPSLPKPELAAWTLIASQIFNLDETLTK